MSTKHTSTVLAKCADDEPIFVLRAQDKHAWNTILYWLSQNRGKLSKEKEVEVANILASFAKWPNRKQPD